MSEGTPEFGILGARPSEAPLNTRPADGWPERGADYDAQLAIQRDQKRAAHTVVPGEPPVEEPVIEAEPVPGEPA